MRDTASAELLDRGLAGHAVGYRFVHRASYSQPNLPVTKVRVSPQHNEAEEMSHSRERVSQIIRSENGRPLAFTISHGDWLKLVTKAMREHVGDSLGAAKRLAEVLECNERTAKNYLNGVCAPSGIHDLRAYAAIPGYAAEKRRLAGMQADLDPKFQADLMKFLRSASEQLDRE